MTSAKERAVEAGARSDAAFDGRSWEALSRAERERYLARARKSQGASFPILAEELVKLVEGEAYGPSHDREGRFLYRTWAHWPTLPDGSKGNRGVDSFLVKHCDALAAELRARIQQMAEAL